MENMASFFVTDTSTGNRITVVDVGNEKSPASYNHTSNGNVDLNMNEIEDMLQRQWNVENASSPVGAEDSKCF